ncbi:hypothetical protein NO1_0719 [Candidatus Termititenax aidoneus]|uniref:Uncharacterized protein n=1 Tax=Termititenax aidoneus TaxID=2218524 RepID=A0A388T9T5_TERA1|nr:hypothetical protein NO1_0719 [Candidatus Termititenax aidoneus]
MDNYPEILRQKYALQERGIYDVILSDLTITWDTPAEKLADNRRVFREFNKQQLYPHWQIDLTETLPKWDSANWVAVNTALYNIVSEAKHAGVKGLVINTAAGRLWNPLYNPRYNNISDSLAEQIIYQRGRDLMQVIENVYPQIEIAVYPVGAFERSTANYTYWHHFVNGLASIQRQQPVKLIFNSQNFYGRFVNTPNAPPAMLDAADLPLVPLYKIPERSGAEEILANIQTLYENYPQIIIRAQYSAL